MEPLPNSGSSVGSLLHLGDDGPAVGIALERLDRLQVVDDRRVDAGVHHGRKSARPLRPPALGEGAIAVVHVPIPGLGQDEALRGLQPQRIHVGDEHQQAGELLTALADAEFGALLDGVDRCRRRHWRVR